mmetsp:Transcript_22786/g.63406  ORF Transcript_22786/g.63406 Transcript_22786/m.63406 type:complete len:103 (-) Transcript_22786:2-310(-)
MVQTSQQPVPFTLPSQFPQPFWTVHHRTDKSASVQLSYHRPFHQKSHLHVQPRSVMAPTEPADASSRAAAKAALRVALRARMAAFHKGGGRQRGRQPAAPCP